MLMEGKKGLVLNVLNKFSLGWSIAMAAAEQGAQVGVGARDERMAENVDKLIKDDPRLDLFMIDMTEDEQFDLLREEVARKYGKIDFLVHSAAFAPKEALTGRFIDTARYDFQVALDVSCYSLVKLCQALEPVMNDEASVMTLSYLGAVRAVGNYNVMGVAKAALESAVRYLSVDLGVRGIRVNTLSPGPINTAAARGVKGLSTMIEFVHDKAPLKRRFAQEEVADTALYLMCDLSRGITGQVIYIDNGYNIVGI